MNTFNINFLNRNGKYHREDGPALINHDGSRHWYIDGKRHRAGGLPAKEMSNGDREWWINGRLHREGSLPAVELADGTKMWFKNGFYFREYDLPVVEKGKELIEWKTKDGRTHRRDGMCALIRTDGHFWYVQGKLHRDFGLPACVYFNGTLCWYQNGNLHREGDLPAIIKMTGEKEFWVHGERYFPLFDHCWTILEKNEKMVEDQMCVITFEPIEKDSRICKCVQCCKFFLFEAIEKWVSQSPTCPHCRTPWASYIKYI